MIKLSINLSDALIGLVQTGRVHIDAIETVEAVPVAVIQRAQIQLPEMPFHLHAGRTGLEWFSHGTLRRLLVLCPQSPWISWHLAPLPVLSTFAALRHGFKLPHLPAEMLISRFIRKVKHLQVEVDRPVILENMPVLPSGRDLFESEPTVITRVIEETGSHLLLDLAHARIASQARHIPVEEYLLSLPLKKVVQVHLAGVREQAGKLYDAHQSLQEADYALLAWLLPRIHPQWATLEYFREDAPALHSQLTQIRVILDKYSSMD